MLKQILTPVLTLLVGTQLLAQPKQTKELTVLPNGWSLSPAGRSLPLGDLPLNIAVSKSGKLMAVTNNGQGVQSIQLIDPVKEIILDTKIIDRSWYGLVFSADAKKLYASGGHNNQVNIYDVKEGKLNLSDSLVLGAKWPNRIGPAGMDIDDQAQLLYVVTKEDNSLYIIDLRTKKILQNIPLAGEAYTCKLSPDAGKLYISCWGCDLVYTFDTKSKQLVRTTRVGDNPNDLILTKDGKRLYVANANDNNVSVIDTKSGKVIETLNTALYPDAPPGSTSNGLALSADEKTLYVANADNNCLAVFDVSKPAASKSLGFIPVGWYPTAVKVVANRIYVANGKGFSSQANPFGPDPLGKSQQVIYQQGDPNLPKQVQYIAGLFKGTMSIIDKPTAAQMSVYARQVYRNTRYSKTTEMEPGGEEGNPIPRKVGDPSPIKYVFYVIKENRTYDQVLGDIKEGNGDPSLVLFGENITPNQHKLAREFVLLDNFYVDGEVSADGHNWTMGAYATDFLEKNWVNSYGGRGGPYDAEGNREAANNKGGFIWDHCRKAGVSYRTYGEFADDYKPNIPVLKGHYCPYYTGYNNSVKDTTRFYQWKREFDSLLRVGAVPRFNSVRFSNDHTEGLRKGRPTPFAHVADNDYAVGLFIEHLSQSPIWKETAVFIIEDDAQNGADHVDAHRSTAYVAGGFVKRRYVDHTPYSTSSMLRTMELILGIPPMTQFDAAATPMWRCFSKEANTTAFASIQPYVNLNEKNNVTNEWQRRSELFNLAKEDAVPDLEFNIVLWHAIKGDKIPFPGPRRAAFFRQLDKRDKDDD